ncbi:MAG: hypothetical protein ACTSYR_05355 [Candidatus Odinarchaeia archaeon]
MSKQLERDKDKSKSKIKSEKSNIEMDIKKINSENIENKLSAESNESVLVKLGKIYPWVVDKNAYPWMYWAPDDKESFKKWVKEWADFTINWFKSNKIHVISIAEMVNRDPFIFFQDKIRCVKSIIDQLVQMKFCYYIEKNRVIRVMWRSLSEWSDVIFNWAIDKGRIEFSLLDILNLNESTDNFHKLPVDDLKKILEILVKKNKARWLSKKNYHIELKIS